MGFWPSWEGIAAKKWKDFRGSDVPAPKPLLSPEEFRVQAEQLGRLDNFCEELEPTGELLELAHRYTAREITFEKFEATVRSWAPKRETIKTSNLDEVFAALDAEKFPEGFLSEADHDRRPLEDRPGFDLATDDTGTLAEMVAQITPENRYAEVPLGREIGKEIVDGEAKLL